LSAEVCAAEADLEEGEKQLDVDNSVYALAFTCMIDELRHQFEFDPFLEDYFFKCTMVFFI